VLAPSTPSDCFWMAIEASRLATKYMTPVFLLSDGYLANGAEPWRIPKPEDLPSFKVEFATGGNGTFMPYSRDDKTLARPWAIPGTPGLEHRVGGLEKESGTGNVSYDPVNHEKMIRVRAEKIERIADDIPELTINGKDSGKVLVIAWGSTQGAINSAIEALHRKGVSVSAVHLRYLNPLPRNLGDIISRFDHVLVPELNLGQLLMIIRARYLVDAIGLDKVQGKPFKVSEIVKAVEGLLGES
jgi:2-oxoglutarate ferredoxin oxidoreductase subunit alpha